MRSTAGPIAAAWVAMLFAAMSWSCTASDPPVSGQPDAALDAADPLPDATDTRRDLGSADVATPDQAFDAGPTDQGLDASDDMPGAADTGIVDASTDAGQDAAFDAGPCVPPVDTPAPLTQLPMLLSETGLYDDTPAGVFADGVRPFQPRYVLWSDGAVKDRFVWIPPCEKIDNTDQDYWSFPVGTRIWKTFTRDGVRVETRLITRWGPGDGEFHMATYVWRDDGTDADFVEFGVQNAKGTAHDVPAIDQCIACHSHLPEPYLGFGAIMLTHSLPGLSIADLNAEGLLTTPTPGGIEIPGSDPVREALGYLHANCSNCHNDSAGAIQFTTPFSLRSHSTETTPDQTGPYRTAVNTFVTRFIHPDCVTRIVPGDPSASCVYVRMNTRGTTDQMPATGTEIVHPAGLQTISDWISAIP